MPAKVISDMYYELVLMYCVSELLSIGFQCCGVIYPFGAEIILRGQSTVCRLVISVPSPLELK